AAAIFAANPALADDTGAFGNAAGNGHEGFVRLMLRYTPDLARRVTRGSPRREVTQLLFAHGMDPNRPDWMRITQLHRFAEAGDLENAAMFIDHGADLHARDEEVRSTPLAWAAKHGKRLMVEFLLRRGARPRLPDDPPWATPIAWATRRGHHDIAQLLTRFDEDGTLPARPDRAHYESVADDLIGAYDTGDVEAVRRVVDYFQIWRLSNLEQLRHQVRLRLGLPEHADDPKELSREKARSLIARLHGVASWPELIANEHQ
ncbi:MAG TPA: ankyrin repeat domain-containing protein, partial [Vicinamibacterales bacterium]|nr:ankyrin repeat domain-containing protein [Vicinamibacterales bacterium]